MMEIFLCSLVLVILFFCIRHYIVRRRIKDIIADIESNDYDTKTIRFLLIRINNEAEDLLYSNSYMVTKALEYVVNHYSPSGKLSPKAKARLVRMLSAI